MSNIEEVLNSTIGRDSLYPLEKSGIAIVERTQVNVDFAISMLSNFKRSYQNLFDEIKGKGYFLEHYQEIEFKILFFAIDKLIGLLRLSPTESNELEASVFQSFLRNQDKYLREVLSQFHET